jgi:hypothetical protein
MDKFTFCANPSASLTPLPKSKTSSRGAGYTGKAMPEKKLLYQLFTDTFVLQNGKAKAESIHSSPICLSIILNCLTSRGLTKKMAASA